MITTLSKLDIEETTLKIIKPICDKTITNIILYNERLKTFPLGSGTKKGAHSHYPY